MRTLLLSIFILAICISSMAQDDKETERVNALRNAVLQDLFANEDKSAAVSDAYKKLFTHVGLAGLPKLADDKDTSIAFQATWELHRKTVKRNLPIPHRTDWVFDKEPMKEFLKSATKLLKSEPPAWWAANLLNGEVFPGQHHAFIVVEEPQPSSARLNVEKDVVVVTSGPQSVRIPKADYDKGSDALDNDRPPVVLCDADLLFIARPMSRGYPFKLIGVDSQTGKTLWAANVWAARRGGCSGPAGGNPVEIRRKGNTVIVYGCESHGMYAEGFDAKTGKCQFRFCTCYWFNNSEAWGLK